MRNLLTFACGMILIALAPASPSIAAEDLRFEQTDAIISGRVLGDYVMVGAGPMIEGHILYPDSPISIEGAEEASMRANRESLKGVDRILLEPSSEFDFDSMAGKAATLRGVLSNKPSPEHHTQVRLKVLEIIIVQE